jgi:hypothetical protein
VTFFPNLNFFVQFLNDAASLCKFRPSLISKELQLLHPFYCQKQGLVDVKLNIFNPEIPGLEIEYGIDTTTRATL